MIGVKIGKLLAASENPRFTQCRIAIGREPRPGEYMLWIQDRWRDFDDAGIRRTLSHPLMCWCVDAAFDSWLATGVAEGRWKP